MLIVKQNKIKGVHPVVALMVLGLVLVGDRILGNASEAGYVAATIVLFVVLPFAVAAILHVPISNAFSLRLPANPLTATAVLAACIVIIPGYVCLNLVLAANFPIVRRMIYQDVGYALKTASHWPLPAVLGAGLGLAWVEEFFFRGFLQNALLRFGPAAAIFLSSGCFALAHHSPGKLLPVFLIGIWFGYAAWSTRSLWVSTVVHFAVNMSILLLARGYFGQLGSLRRKPLPQPDFWLVGLLVLAMVIVVCLVESRRRQSFESA